MKSQNPPPMSLAVSPATALVGMTGLAKKKKKNFTLKEIGITIFIFN